MGLHIRNGIRYGGTVNYATNIVHRNKTVADYLDDMPDEKTYAEFMAMTKEEQDSGDYYVTDWPDEFAKAENIPYGETTVGASLDTLNSNLLELEQNSEWKLIGETDSKSDVTFNIDLSDKREVMVCCTSNTGTIIWGTTIVPLSAFKVSSSIDAITMTSTATTDLYRTRMIYVNDNQVKMRVIANSAKVIGYVR